MPLSQQSNGCTKPISDVDFVASSINYKNVILDLGGVLFSFKLDVSYGTTLHPLVFSRMLRSKIWFEYEQGKLCLREVVQQLSLSTQIPEDDIQSFVANARKSLALCPQMLRFVDCVSGKLRLFCMTNISHEDFDYIQKMFPSVLGKFERIFTSAKAEMRKPNLNFFRHVLKETGINPSETVFVDDTLENFVAAQSLGITSILAGDVVGDTVQQLRFTLLDEEERLLTARKFMFRQRGCPSITSDGARVGETFTHFLIADVLNDASFLAVSRAPETGLFKFFTAEELEGFNDPATNAYTLLSIPYDLDCTSIALSVLHKFSRVGLETINDVIDRMLQFINEDGIVQVYFDPLRPRVDPVAATNIVYLFHVAGRPQLTKATEEFIYGVLRYRAYKHGTLYYNAPEAFLFYLSRLVHDFKAHFKKAGFVELLSAQLRERIGMQGDALTLAMRVIACTKCEIPNTRDRDSLARMQKIDGSWPVCPAYRYGRDPNSWFGNEALTTAYALKALELSRKSE